MLLDGSRHTVVVDRLSITLTSACCTVQGLNEELAARDRALRRAAQERNQREETLAQVRPAASPNPPLQCCRHPTPNSQLTTPLPNKHTVRVDLCSSGPTSCSAAFDACH